MLQRRTPSNKRPCLTLLEEHEEEKQSEVTESDANTDGEAIANEMVAEALRPLTQERDVKAVLPGRGWQRGRRLADVEETEETDQQVG